MLIEDTRDQELVIAELELKMMEERRRKEKKRYKDKKRDTDAMDHRGNKRGHRDSINDNDDKDGSPIKREKNRKRSRDNEDTSPSDTEWQHGGFKGIIYVYLTNSFS